VASGIPTSDDPHHCSYSISLEHLRTDLDPSTVAGWGSFAYLLDDNAYLFQSSDAHLYDLGSLPRVYGPGTL
jgi:hypothetical protein